MIVGWGNSPISREPRQHCRLTHWSMASSKSSSLVTLKKRNLRSNRDMAMPQIQAQQENSTAMPIAGMLATIFSDLQRRAETQRDGARIVAAQAPDAEIAVAFEHFRLGMAVTITI